MGKIDTTSKSGDNPGHSSDLLGAVMAFSHLAMLTKTFAFFVLAWHLCAPAQAADRIRIGVTNYNLTYLSAGVALKRGFFKAEGLDVEIIRMTPNVSVVALTNGDVDYSMLFGLRAVQGELDLRAR